MEFLKTPSSRCHVKAGMGLAFFSNDGHLGQGRLVVELWDLLVPSVGSTAVLGLPLARTQWLDGEASPALLCSADTLAAPDTSQSEVVFPQHHIPPGNRAVPGSLPLRLLHHPTPCCRTCIRG